MSVPQLGFVVFYGDGKRLLGPYEDHQFLCPRNAGVDQVPLEEEVVLGQDREDNGRVLAPWDLWTDMA